RPAPSWCDAGRGPRLGWRARGRVTSGQPSTVLSQSLSAEHAANSNNSTAGINLPVSHFESLNSTMKPATAKSALVY
ncbi:MAG: hypothetical protein AAF404_20695, partial [Pseudomonadota bacterium]